MNAENKTFEKFFKLVSYGVALCGMLSLFVSGGIGVIVAALFVGVLFLAWFFENTKWQIGSRVGVILIFVIIPLFYLDWKYRIIGSVGTGTFAVGSLGKLILFLCAVKILQNKTDRDWIFIYLIAFFEVLLAAGLSISPLYLGSLILYLLLTVCAFVLFEMRKTSGEILAKNVRKEMPAVPLRKIPFTAVSLLIGVLLLSIPLFFTFPRVGSAGIGSGNGTSNRMTGFSDNVKLGAIGQLLQNDEVVMRVRLETNAGNVKNLRWRGIALDYFDNQSWSKSSRQKNLAISETQKNIFVLNTTTKPEEMVEQTIYLEPLQTQVLFTLINPVLIQGNFNYISKDAEDSVITNLPGLERISYKVFSDVQQPGNEILKTDNGAYDVDSARYLQLPDKMDARIGNLAANITANQRTKFEKARAVENYLQTRFGYTLDLKAGGDEPLADFLFNIREGHCEYFATAMAVMLRTQGIATRVVNGFQAGEYNSTADAYIVKQKNAHSWVEVYFPENNAWITFDPTPFAGRSFGGENVGILGSFGSYFEALETFWIQYFVAYDNNEQRSLFRSVKSGFVDYQAKTSVWLDQFQRKINDWWKEVRGDKGFQTSAVAIAWGAGYLIGAIGLLLFLVWIFRKVVRLKFWKNMFGRFGQKTNANIIEFYERMQNVLASKGFVRKAHQTPLEFAFTLDMPEAVKITERYNYVRFGEKDLSEDEAREIENWLGSLENKSTEKQSDN